MATDKAETQPVRHRVAFAVPSATLWSSVDPPSARSAACLLLALLTISRSSVRPLTQSLTAAFRCSAACRIVEAMVSASVCFAVRLPATRASRAAAFSCSQHVSEGSTVQHTLFIRGQCIGAAALVLLNLASSSTSTLPEMVAVCIVAVYTEWSVPSSQNCLSVACREGGT